MMADWLTTLQTDTPQEGFELAITLARKGVGYTQPSAEIREKLRPEYEENADSLTFASQDRKSTRLNSSHVAISYAVFCLKKKKEKQDRNETRRQCTT